MKLKADLLKKYGLSGIKTVFMKISVRFLGGVDEIGANSCYLYLDGTGIVIDAGLHPNKRDKQAFPFYEAIASEPVDLCVITHGHTDHIGAIPFLIKNQPQVKLLASEATCDIVPIMLKDAARLLKTEVAIQYGAEIMSLYKKEILEKISSVMEGIKYRKKFEYCGRSGRLNITITLYPAGHILGSASVLIECGGYSILHTGDINLKDQKILKKAGPPKHHLDCLITECTNVSDLNLKEYDYEIKSFAAFINEVANANGSVLVPCFALGKTQETLKILYNLMRKGSIPSMPIYTAGIGKRISRLYDINTYIEPMLNPGFEVSDIPQESIQYDALYTGKYFKESSIVLVPSGMMNKGTLSYKLAQKWFRLKNFGIALVGFQDESSPGYALLGSKENIEFEFGGNKVKRRCMFGKFRFTSHALFDDLVSYIEDVKPGKLFIIHGSPESGDRLALEIRGRLTDTMTFIPKTAEEYILTE
ncbi:MAG: hypothetical protein QG635_1460 [Bacteroidota bacterium]|nr:hypothetical protein [Bacteroidota bacterium]